MVRQASKGAAISNRLNPTAASLLGFLLDGPKSGWDLVATARARIGDFWTLTQSQVYRELGSMAEAGLVTAGERGSRDRRPYRITDAGRSAFAEWLEREPGAESIRFPLLLALGFGAHVPPGRLAQWLAEHRALHAERLAGYEAAGTPPDPYAAATLDFGIRYERAVLDWFDSLPPEIASADEPEARPTASPARPSQAPATSRAGRARTPRT